MIQFTPPYNQKFYFCSLFDTLFSKAFHAVLFHS